TTAHARSSDQGLSKNLLRPNPSHLSSLGVPMTTLLDQTVRSTSTTPAQRLRMRSAAVRVSMRWLGVRKTLTPEQKSQAAEPFNAAGEFLSARKKLLDTSHPAYKDVTAVRGRVLSYWKGCTLPYPEPGVRLIKQDQVEAFNQQMEEFRRQLEEAVAG